MGSPVRTDTAPILIADDDEAVRASLALLLKQAGYRTHAVGPPMRRSSGWPSTPAPWCCRT